MAPSFTLKSKSLATLVPRPCFGSSFPAYASTIRQPEHRLPDGAKVNGPVESVSKLCIKPRMSPARASWLFVSPSAKLDEKQRQHVAQIRAAHSDLDIAYDLTQTFVSMLADHRDTDLDQWLAQAEHSGIRELKSFAHGIQRDYVAVRATFTSEWSNGPVEAQVNCLKLQKRLMFGRANFDLLRLHVLRRA